MACVVDFEPELPQQHGLDLWNFSCTPYQSLSLGVVAASLVPMMRGPQTLILKILVISSKQEDGYCSVGWSIPMRTGPIRHGHVADRVTGDCSSGTDLAWTLVRQVERQPQERQRAEGVEGYFARREELALCKAVVLEEFARTPGRTIRIQTRPAGLTV